MKGTFCFYSIYLAHNVDAEKVLEKIAEAFSCVFRSSQPLTKENLSHKRHPVALSITISYSVGVGGSARMI